jgi:hypothetical protein
MRPIPIIDEDGGLPTLATNSAGPWPGVGKRIVRRQLMGSVTGRRIHEYLSVRAAVKTDAGTPEAAPSDESKVRFARHPQASGQ